jgi:hypothetical protein
MNKPPTTDEIDKITAEERVRLVGFCNIDFIWTHFKRGRDKEVCNQCGGRFSNVQGFQITTERTWNPDKKVSAADKKKMGA